MRTRGALLGLALGAVLWAPLVLTAQRKPIVAVFDVEAKRIKLDRAALSALSSYLGSRLSESGVYEVVPPDKLKQALVVKKKESYKQCFAQSCQIEIGQELAADKALSTQVMKIGTKCMVTCNLYDLKKSTSGRAATHRGGCTEDGISASFDVVVAKLTGRQIFAPPAPAPAPAPPAPSPAPSPERATEITNARDGSKMVLVPAGAFLRGSAMGDGSDDERPQRSIYLDAFYVDRHEVTVAQYRRCVQAGGCTVPGTRKYCNWNESGRGAHPVNCVDWSQARAYCAWAGKRLPTEAQWEKAARGTDGRRYPWGSEAPTCRRAVMRGDGGNGCGKDRTWPVGSKPAGASPYGAQDMAGNVWEWVNDWYDKDTYASSPGRNPTGPSSGSARVVRGGSFSFDSAAFLRAAYRYSGTPSSLPRRGAVCQDKMTLYPFSLLPLMGALRAPARFSAGLLQTTFGLLDDKGERRDARVVRGGSYNNDNATNLRAANRNNNTPTNRNNNIGVRCVSTRRRFRHSQSPWLQGARSAQWPSPAALPGLSVRG